jgi:hypothetical protein
MLKFEPRRLSQECRLHDSIRIYKFVQASRYAGRSDPADL